MKRIKSLKITGSSFFVDTTLTFSDKLSCIMGGRGTGKSTLLHFLTAALEVDSEGNDTTYNILKNNLKNGEIRLVIEGDDGKTYEIIKTIGDEPQPYIVPSNHHIPIDQISEQIKCDIYPALKIEDIGRNSTDRLRLIDKMISTEVIEFKGKVREVQHLLTQNAQSIRNENAKFSQLSETIKNYSTVEEELKTHKENQPEDIIKKEQEEFEAADQKEKTRNAEKRYVKRIKDKLSELAEGQSQIEDDVSGFVSTNSDTARFTNKDLLGAIRDEMSKSLSLIISNSQKAKATISNAIEAIAAVQKKLKVKHDQQENDFVQLKLKFEIHWDYYNKYITVSKKVEEKSVLKKELQEIEKNRKALKVVRGNQIKILNSLKQEIFLKRKEKIDLLNDQFGGDIRITIGFGGITDQYEELLRNGLRGSNMKYNILIPSIVSNFTPDRLATIIHEKDEESLKQIPGIDEERSKAIITALHETEYIYKIESLYNEDLPEFLLKIDAKEKKDAIKKDYYKKTDELSTGQRCTAVLPVIFAVSTNPLLIDQPEDNLDNKYISEAIHKIIRDQKTRRQLIFITHNPNIPVLSNAETNIFLSYGDGKSKIEKQGTITDVQDRILGLLEGGREAFNTRKELYGE